METAKYTPVPPRKVNGGLYTGEAFPADAPWRNFPVIPDASYMINVNLRSANPPLQALFQYPGGTRPGNNYLDTIGLQRYVNEDMGGSYDFKCLSCEKFVKPKPECKCKRVAPISGNFVGCQCDKMVFVPI